MWQFALDKTWTVLSHCMDTEKLFTLPKFDSISKNLSGNIKPWLIFNTDGGLDETSRYAKVITVAIHHFLKYDSNGFYIACNASRRSTFKRVERRMSSLSIESAEVILP